LKVKLLWSRGAKDGLKKKEYIEKTKKINILIKSFSPSPQVPPKINVGWDIKTVTFYLSFSNNY